MTIQGKVVAITGAGRGIGRATALHLAARGARVVLGARSETELLDVAREIERAGGEAALRSTDVTRRLTLNRSSVLAATVSAGSTLSSTMPASARSPASMRCGWRTGTR